MKRVIKFRGYCEEKGCWCYGDYAPHEGEAFICSHLDKVEDFPLYSKVSPDSVGQFTGLKDIHGREIYEGDIVHDEFGYYAIEYCDIFHAFKKVSYKNKAVIDLEGNNALIHYEVVGNIYDNPELLEPNYCRKEGTNNEQ